LVGIDVLGENTFIFKREEGQAGKVAGIHKLNEINR
jgi:hypothetical protein